MRPVIDLVDRVAGAERRPTSAAGTVLDVDIGGDSRRALGVPAVSRIIWTVRGIPARSELRTAVAIQPQAVEPFEGAVVFRIGMSDGRTYEEIFSRRIGPGASADTRRWTPVVVDLSRYGGWQWSVFYRPDTLTWQVIFNTNASVAGQRAEIVAWWGEPAIYAPAGRDGTRAVDGLASPAVARSFDFSAAGAHTSDIAPLLTGRMCGSGGRMA